MNDLQTMLERIENYIKPTVVDADDNRMLRDGDIAIYLRVEVHATGKTMGFPPLQAVISVATEDRKVWSYGADNEEDNQIIIDWFVRMRNVAREREHRKMDATAVRLKDTLGIK